VADALEDGVTRLDEITPAAEAPGAAVEAAAVPMLKHRRVGRPAATVLLIVGLAAGLVEWMKGMQDQAVSCNRHPIREDRAELSRRRPARRKRRLA
jgi:hypothetical protein